MMQIRICVDMKNSPLSLDLLPESPVGSGEMICIVLGALNDEYNLAKKKRCCRCNYLYKLYEIGGEKEEFSG